ncbi:MAG: peptidoglycan editing factor PgeF [Eubacteriales bacterium]|nr:peptidoglycan editing factor PgeF [Eubacteriales bacterium]
MQDICHGFTLWKKEGVRYLTIPAFDKAGGVVCAFSTRIGGVSAKPYDTLNFSRKREQNNHNYLENMKRFAHAAGFNHENAVSINYAHSAVIYKADESDKGHGVVSGNLAVTCDGLVTDTVNLPLISYHADCVPLFFYDPKRRAVAICHAGWKGVASHMATSAISSLTGIGCMPKDILAAIGPCISVKHFEVKQDVGDIFKYEFGDNTIEIRDGRIYIDLVKSCVIDMLNSGIEPQNMTVSDLCTYEDSYLFFSHRRDKGKTGSMAAVIKLLNE